MRGLRALFGTQAIEARRFFFSAFGGWAHIIIIEIHTMQGMGTWTRYRMVGWHLSGGIWLQLRVIFPIEVSQGYCEENVLCRLNLHAFGLWRHMVTCAQFAANLRLPIPDIPLKPAGGDDARFSEGDQPDMFSKNTILAFLGHMDLVLACFEEKGQAGAGEEEDAAGFVGWVGVEEVEVVELADALVNAAADAAEGDDVDAGRLVVADPGDGFAKVGGLLVVIVDDGGGCGLGRVEVTNSRVQ